MDRLRSLIALALLTILTVGGTVAPVVHRVAHAEEMADTQARHASVEHHHHTEADMHGTEVVPACPEPLADHFACVLCAAASGAVATAHLGAFAPEAGETPEPLETPSPRTQTHAAHGARGPPAQA